MIPHVNGRAERAKRKVSDDDGKELRQVQQRLDEKDQQLTDKDKQLVNKDREIAKKDKEIAEKDKQIAMYWGLLPYHTQARLWPVRSTLQRDPAHTSTPTKAMTSIRIRELCQEIDERRCNYSKLKHEAETEYREILKLNTQLRTTHARTRLVTMGLIEYRDGGFVHTEKGKEWASGVNLMKIAGRL